MDGYDYMTSGAAAAAIGVNRLTIQRWAQSGRLRGVIMIGVGEGRAPQYAIPAAAVELERLKRGVGEGAA